MAISAVVAAVAAVLVPATGDVAAVLVAVTAAAAAEAIWV